MFEKWKENWKNHKIQQHFEQNKDAYILGAGCLAAGWILRDLTHTFHPAKITNSVAPVINNAPVFNNDNSSIVNFGGTMSKIVKCSETGEIWEKVTASAKAAGCSAATMSKHLNGHQDHVNGLHYEIIGLSSAG